MAEGAGKQVGELPGNVCHHECTRTFKCTIIVYIGNIWKCLELGFTLNLPYLYCSKPLTGNLGFKRQLTDSPLKINFWLTELKCLKCMHIPGLPFESSLWLSCREQTSRGGEWEGAQPHSPPAQRPDQLLQQLVNQTLPAHYCFSLRFSVHWKLERRLFLSVFSFAFF